MKYLFNEKINGVDVTCKTHHECVKLIKKTGDTLALKVYTSPNAMTLLQPSSNFTSTSIINGTIPSSINSNTKVKLSYIPQNIHQDDAISKSYSYYATSTITSSSPQVNHQLTEIQNRSDLNAFFFDGTKSLPSKKKRKKIFLIFFRFYNNKIID